MPTAAYVESRATDPDRLERLERVVTALAQAKESDEWFDDAYWLGFFDEPARARFWWPTEAEREEWSRRWSATPVEQRLTDPTLRTPWDFGSMIDAFRNGEYRLGACRRIGRGICRLEFEPFAYPFGGSECMVALVEAFGFTFTTRGD